MNPQLQQFQEELDALKIKIEKLYRSSDIDRNVETALIERLSNTFPVVQGTSTASTQSVSVPATPTNITVPAQPSGTLQVTFKGTTYYLYYQ